MRKPAHARFNHDSSARSASRPNPPARVFGDDPVRARARRPARIAAHRRRPRTVHRQRAVNRRRAARFAHAPGAHGPRPNMIAAPVLHTLLLRTGHWLRRHTRGFSRSDFWPGRAFLEAFTVLAAWVLPAIAGVVATGWLGGHRSVTYLQAAIQEGIGPHIWNVFGTLGAVLFGLLVAAPTQRWLALAAHQVMLNAYSLGALMLGLLLGQWICIGAPPASGLLHASLRTAGIGALFSIAFGLNLAVWYVAFLASPKRLHTGFMLKIAQCAPQFRVPLAATIVTAALAALYLYLGR
ncbi:hypothetical protein [Burkholderia pseudomallei]|uniref:hypothetical protein n=1 Tax=Burkholderia pseudomallei TaxID=28450 RepID=UPI00057232F0|nr:hypothetical protein [Burkholderia pseudomallei]